MTFKKTLTKSLEMLIGLLHSFTKQYFTISNFKKLKEDAPLNTAIIVMDFSQNYPYTIQNEIQSSE